MPFTTTPKTTNYNPREELPQHLDHKPVYALPYQRFDGANGGPRSEVQFISVGIAQYDRYAISVKVMRHGGKKWTRQAEELPPHRVVDMTLFLSKVLLDAEKDTIKIPVKTFQHQDDNGICVFKEDQRTVEELRAFDEAVHEVTPNLKERLNVLYEFLHEMKQQHRL